MNTNLMLEISELQKIYKQTKSIYKSQVYSYKNRVRQCTFTNNMLKHPVLMCKRGFLFNSEALLKALEKKNLPQRLSYIKSEADVCKVNLNPNKTKKNRFPFCCPLTAKVLNGLNPFVLIWSCGCLMYEKLLFPLASIKMPLDQIVQKRENDEDDEGFREEKLKCPNCQCWFALSSLYSLNLSSRRLNRAKQVKKAEEQGDHTKDLLGKRAGAGSDNAAPNGTKRVKNETKREDSQKNILKKTGKISRNTKK